MAKIIDLRKSKNNASMAWQKATPKIPQQRLEEPHIKLASLPAALSARKPSALIPELRPETKKEARPAPAEVKPEPREYLAALLAWSAEQRVPSNEERRGKNIVIIGGGGIITLAALFWGNYLLGIFIALAAFVLYASGSGKSRAVKCAITPQGIKIENRVYEFSDIKSFWIFYDPSDIKELSLESRKTMMPQIRAPLGDTDPIKLRETLLKFIPEKKHEESLSDIIGRKFFE